jgi:hypothetical protein
MVLGPLFLLFMLILTFDPVETGVYISSQGWLNWMVLSLVAYTLGFLAWMLPRFTLPLLLIGGLSAIAADLLGFFSYINAGIGVLMLIGALIAYQNRNVRPLVYPSRDPFLWTVLAIWLLFMLTVGFGLIGVPSYPTVFKTVTPLTGTPTTTLKATTGPSVSPTR